MSHITDRNFIIGIFLNVRDKENKIKCSQLSQQFGNMSLPLDNTIESENRYLKHIYSRKIAEYIAGHYFGPETKNVMNILIEFYYETYGKDSLNNILHDLYKDYRYVFHNKFVNKDKIDNAITTILSYKPSIEYSVFSYSCYVAYYNLIKHSFDSGIKLKYAKIHPLMRVINSNTDTSNIIRIIDLFLDNGLDIIDFVNTEYFFMSCKLDVIKYIIDKSNNYKQHYLHDICQCIKEINLAKYNEKDFTNMIDYFVQKTLEYYGTIDTLSCYGITPLRTIYSNYIVTQYKHQFQYVVSKLILYGADITLLKDKVYVPLYQYREEDELIVLEFYDYINNIMVKRSDAIEYVRSVSEYLLPDIANVVFDHAYNFDPNEHYDLAISL